MPLSLLLSYGSSAGGWTYPLIRSATLLPLWYGIVVAGVLLLLRLGTRRLIERYPTICILAWTLLGFLSMLALHFLSYFSLGSLVSSDLSNGFFTTSLKYGTLDVLAKYPYLPNTPLHVWTNMPGKILLFHFLELFTLSPQSLGVLIVLLASLSGLLLYFLLRELGWNRTTALDAWILWIVTPALIGFLPILNTVTVTFALLVFILVLKAIKKNSVPLAIASGIAAFWLFLFEPTPFVLAFIGLSIIVLWIREGSTSIRTALKMIGIASATFITAAVIIQLSTGFNSVRALTHIIGDALSFDAAKRPYWIWILQQLEDFFLGAGFIPSAFFLCSIVIGHWSLMSGHRLSDQRPLTSRPATLFLGTTTLITILFLDLSGIGRGEVVRFWIFLMPFVSVVAAATCRKRSWLFPVIVIATILQTALSVWSVVFVLPTNPFLL